MTIKYCEANKFAEGGCDFMRILYMLEIRTIKRNLKIGTTPLHPTCASMYTLIMKNFEEEKNQEGGRLEQKCAQEFVWKFNLSYIRVFVIGVKIVNVYRIKLEN